MSAKRGEVGEMLEPEVVPSLGSPALEAEEVGAALLVALGVALVLDEGVGMDEGLGADDGAGTEDSPWVWMVVGTLGALCDVGCGWMTGEVVGEAPTTSVAVYQSVVVPSTTSVTTTSSTVWAT